MNKYLIFSITLICWSWSSDRITNQSSKNLLETLKILNVIDLSNRVFCCQDFFIWIFELCQDTWETPKWCFLIFGEKKLIGPKLGFLSKFGLIPIISDSQELGQYFLQKTTRCWNILAKNFFKIQQGVGISKWIKSIYVIDWENLLLQFIAIENSFFLKVFWNSF